ncbi:MAG: hypothetical protein IKK66_02035, partial [Ruminococcus sp.]|nr:hypothetical protein [Ruminococcus sp.]
MKKMKRIAAVAAALVVCAGTVTYLPQIRYSVGIKTAYCAETEWHMDINYQLNNDVRFHVGDEEIIFNDNVTVKVSDYYGNVLIENESINSGKFIIDTSNVDTSAVGMYPVYVTL